MSIDLFTFVAQIINLIILLFLLRKFLYIPVLKAVDERQKFIERELRKAASSHKKALDLEEECKKKMAEIEITKQQILLQTKDEAKLLADKLADEAKVEFSRSQKQWKSRLSAQQKTFELALQNLVVEHFQIFANEALKQMADVSLNDLFIDKLKEEITNLSAKKRKEFADAYQNKMLINIQSANKLSADKRLDLTNFLTNEFELSDDVKFKFSVNNKLVCGIAILAEDQLIAWNLAGYLNSFEKNMNHEVAQLVNG